MLTTLSLFLASGQIAAPILPPGVHPAFHEAVYAVEERLEKGEFDEAEKLMAVFPPKQVRVQWDDKLVPSGLRAEFAEARDAALQMWASGMSCEFVIVKDKPHVQFTFQPRLPAPPGKSLPAGSAHFLGDEPNKPRMEAVIGLNRGDPAQPAMSVDVLNEVGHSIGIYMGLAPSPLPGGVMGKSDLPSAGRLSATPSEISTARRNQRAVQDLRVAILKKARLTPAKPEIFVDPREIDLSTVTQGTRHDLVIQVTNRGTGTLMFRGQPDCGCVAAAGVQTVEPGATVLFRALFDATEFVGDLVKKIHFFTNDPARPTFELPITVKVTPLYRLLMDHEVVLMPDGGTSVDVILAVADGAQIRPSAARLDGVPGEVSYEAWSGTVADPKLSEPARPRKGFRFRVKIDDELPPGRVGATLAIQTTNPQFPVLRQTIYLQKGIVALPDQLYLGEVGAGPRRTSLLLSRPEVGFKVLRIDSDSRSLVASAKPVRGSWEHQVTVEYKGQAKAGPLEGMIRVHTDDPKQKVILIPFRGTVR